MELCVYDGLADLSGKVENEVNIVDGGQAVVEDFAGHVEVAKVGAGKVLAGVALAIWIDRRRVGGELGVNNI